MFDFSSSQMQLVGKTVTYYAVLSVLGALRRYCCVGASTIEKNKQ